MFTFFVGRVKGRWRRIACLYLHTKLIAERSIIMNRPARAKIASLDHLDSCCGGLSVTDELMNSWHRGTVISESSMSFKRHRHFDQEQFTYQS
jgi:hypothetical protein